MSARMGGALLRALLVAGLWSCSGPEPEPVGAGSNNVSSNNANSCADEPCEPLSCGQDERVSAHECIPCLEGRTNPSGDDAAGPDTACEASSEPCDVEGTCPPACEVSEVVVNGECVGCPAGTMMIPGGDAVCDPVLCAANEHVSNNTCVPCEPGSASPAGGAASGMDTTCASIICAEDEHVSSNECVPCPSTTTRSAGDDARGPDTTCADVCQRTLGVDCSDYDEAYIKASNTQSSDRFGRQLAFDGDTLVVGTYFEDGGSGGINGDQGDNSAGWAGAVYVFVRAGGTWTQQAYVKASLPEGGDHFGYSVALDGDTLVVGAPGEDGGVGGVGGAETDNSRLDAGAVYVFARNGSTWSQQAYLKSGAPREEDGFGSVVDVDGDTIVIGAPLEGAGDQGAAYVFRQSGLSWAQEARLVASDAKDQDQFAEKLVLDGDTVIAAAPQRDTNVGPAVGGLYVFSRAGGSWAQESVIENPDAARGLFGWSLALQTSTLVVAARNNANRGVVYVYERAGAVWTPQATLTAIDEGFLGQGLAIDGDLIAIGAPVNGSGGAGLAADPGDNSAPFSGAVHLFERGTWDELAFVKSSNPDADDYFGSALSLQNGTLCVGALNEASDGTGIDGNQSDNSLFSAGAVYVLRVQP